MARSSITKAYNKIQELSWEPTFATPVQKYPTDYKFNKAPKKEPLKQVLQSYFPMQEEKDNRAMGAMDGALRGIGSVRCRRGGRGGRNLFVAIGRSPKPLPALLGPCLPPRFPTQHLTIP